MNWFGKKSRSPASDSNVVPERPVGSITVAAHETIARLRETTLNLDKREEHIQRKMDACVREAKMKMAKGDKKGALFSMKRKKLYEQEAIKLENVKMTLETQMITLESSAQMQSSVQALQAGSQAMKQMQKAYGVEKVDSLMEDIQEGLETNREIQDALAQSVDPLLVADEDELLEELNELEQAEMENELLAPPSNLSFPAVPETPAPAAAPVANTTEEDLAKLEAELAILS